MRNHFKVSAILVIALFASTARVVAQTGEYRRLPFRDRSFIKATSSRIGGKMPGTVRGPNRRLRGAGTEAAGGIQSREAKKRHEK